LVLAGGATTVPPLLQRAIIIEPVNSPSKLDERGYSADVVARRLRDELRQIYLEARHIGQTIGVADTGAETRVPEVDVPIAGLSLRAVVGSIRELLGLDDVRVGGEITVALEAPAPNSKKEEDAPEAPPRYLLRLRQSGQGSFHISAEPNQSIDFVIKAGAIALLEELNPLMAARWYERRIRLDDLERVIRRMEARPKPSLVIEAGIMRGNLLMRRRRTDDAVRQYDTVIAKDPTATRARVFKSQALLRGGRFEAAIAAADDALATDPQGAALAHAFRADALRFLQRDAEAEAAANVARDVLPSNGQALVTLTYIYLQRNEVGRALETAKQAVLRDPDLPTGYGAVGNVLLRMGKAEEGLAETMRAHSMDPTNQFLTAGLIRHLRLLGRFKVAAEVADRALKEDPDNPALLLARAQIHNLLGEFAPGLAVSERLLVTRPRHQDAALERARALLGLRRFSEARGRAEELLSNKNVAADALAVILNALLAEDKIAEATTRAAAAQAQHPESPSVMEASADIAFKRKEWAEAARLLRQTIALDPARATALRHRLSTADRQDARRR
jgi:tetratricopeptide (TPR) repeat protein